MWALWSYSGHITEADQALTTVLRSRVLLANVAAARKLQLRSGETVHVPNLHFSWIDNRYDDVRWIATVPKKIEKIE